MRAETAAYRIADKRAADYALNGEKNNGANAEIFEGGHF
jgi:hypothetical protein